MELFYTPETFRFNTAKLILSTGHELIYPSHLNGGGDDQWAAFQESITLNGKSKYTKGLEWCSGMGLLGFECLLNNICEEITFHDFYDKAIESCIKSAKDLNLDNRIKTHLSPTVANLPENEVYDFIIGNPPHVFEKEEFVTSARNYSPDISEDSIMQNCRLVLDSNGGIHKNFFENIRPHIHADTDIFLSGSISNILKIEEMAKAANLRVLHGNTVNINWEHPHIKIYHLRPY